jgi:hypothetical protein
LPRSSDIEEEITPIEFRTFAFARFLEDEHLARAVSTFPASGFILDSCVSDLVAIFDEQLPDSFCSKPLLSGVAEI